MRSMFFNMELASFSVFNDRINNKNLDEAKFDAFYYKFWHYKFYFSVIRNDFLVYEVYNHNKLVVVKWMQYFYSWERWNLVYKESHVNIVKNRSLISLANRRKATPALEGDVIIPGEVMQNLALCTYGFFFYLATPAVTMGFGFNDIIQRTFTALSNVMKSNCKRY